MTWKKVVSFLRKKYSDTSVTAPGDINPSDTSDMDFFDEYMVIRTSVG